MDTTRLLLEMAADLLNQLAPVTVEAQAIPDDFQPTQPGYLGVPLDLEVGDA